jgi:hypothetical protein
VVLWNVLAKGLWEVEWQVAKGAALIWVHVFVFPAGQWARPGARQGSSCAALLNEPGEVMLRKVVCLFLLILSGQIGAVAQERPRSSLGVVLLHGKGGQPGGTSAGLGWMRP